MKLFVVCYLSTVLTAPLMATPSREMQAVQAIHETWEFAFENADLDAIEKLWAHDGDVWLVTPLGTIHNGWAEVKGALKNLFGLLGQTMLDISDPFITIDGDDASMTMRYNWSPAGGRIFRLTERYRKVEGFWKLQVSDAQGNLLPLRPDDEKAIKLLADPVKEALLAKDIGAIEAVVAADFTYTDFNGTQHEGWQASAPLIAADLEGLAELQLESMALVGNQACGRYTLTPIDGTHRSVQFSFTHLTGWKLAAINLNPDAESLAVVQPNNTYTTTWGRIKTNRK